MRKKLIIIASLFLFGSVASSATRDPNLFGPFPIDTEKVVQNFCKEVNKHIKKYYWGKIICNPKTWTWEQQYITPGGNPLVYKVVEPEDSQTTTLFLCGVHGDELSAPYQCFHLVRDMLFDNPGDYKKSKVVIAPLVNPDGFFLKRPTRQNLNGIDINRNFPTRDFDEKAIAQWKRRTKSSKRKYPGTKGGSEIETQFQIMLIDRFKPDKIVTIHSPYGWLDVDSPAKVATADEPDGFDFGRFLQKSKNIAKVMSKKSGNYRVINFRVYPGSLGNYAAKERGIPTYTLELPTSASHKAYAYWRKMRRALVAAIQYKITKKKK